MDRTVNRDVVDQHRVEMLREAELYHLEKVLRTERKRRTRWSSTVAWEVARVAGLLGKYFKTLKKEG